MLQITRTRLLATWMAIACFVLTCCAHGDTELDEFAKREQAGFFEVLKANSMVLEYQAGRIAQPEFLDQCSLEYPALTAVLLQDWGGVNSCFLRDLLFGQTNGVVRVAENGNIIFFEVDRYLDDDGNVIPEMMNKYVMADEANTILQDLTVAWELDPECNFFPELNNKCCANTSTEHCNTSTGRRCTMDQSGQSCIGGSTRCLQAEFILPTFQSLHEVDDHFGPMQECTFISTEFQFENSNWRMHWLEGGFTEYDIASTPLYADMSYIAGELETRAGTLVFLGTRVGQNVMLIDVDLLFAGALKAKDIATEILHGDMFDSAMAEACTAHYITPNHEQICLTAARSNASIACINIDDSAVSLTQTDDKSAYRTLAGGYQDPNLMHVRLSILDGITNTNSCIVGLGLMTLRDGVRRFDGMLPPNDLWKNRRELARSLNQLDDHNVLWHEGEWNESAAESLLKSTGRPVSREEFQGVLTQAFGSVRGAIPLDSIGSEVAPVPFIVIDRAGQKILIGASWRWPEVSETGSLQHVKLFELALPADPNSMTGTLNYSRLHADDIARHRYQVHLQDVPQ